MKNNVMKSDAANREATNRNVANANIANRNTPIYLYAAIFVIALLAAGGIQNNGQGKIMQTASNPQIKGTVTMAGSTSMETLANALAEGFMNRYPQVVVTAEFTGSSAGIEAVLAGTADIGNSSRRLRDEEKEAGAVEHVVAIDGIVLVTDAENPVRALTKAQLYGIYRGEIRNWSEVGGRDRAIVVVGREAGSGTRESFEASLEAEDRCVYANELNSTGAVMARVSSTPGAIGYVSWEVLDDTVTVLAIDGIMPAEETIGDGRYVLSRPYVMVTKGASEEQSEAVQAFLRYISSVEGKELLKRASRVIPAENDSGFGGATCFNMHRINLTIPYIKGSRKPALRITNMREWI